MIGNFMQQLEEMKKKTEEAKARLDHISVTGESPEGSVKITMNGNRKVSAVSFDSELANDPEMLEDLLVIAFNRTLEQAEKVNEAEMGAVAKGMLPGMM